MLGFFVAFAVKLPAVPLHTWLPDAHTEAPTAGSVILAGLLLKTGAYGLLRFAVPLFPAGRAAPSRRWRWSWRVVGILYGAVLAFAQTDLKRLVAYTSVSHMGFVLLGVFAWNALALQGAVMQMLCHGVSTGALFILVGHPAGAAAHARPGPHGRAVGHGAAHGRRRRCSSPWPRWACRGWANFVGEFLVLLGAYQVKRAAGRRWPPLGLVASAIYAAVDDPGRFPRAEHANAGRCRDLRRREAAIAGVDGRDRCLARPLPAGRAATTRQSVHSLQQIVSTYEPSQTTQAPREPADCRARPPMTERRP